MSLLASSRAAMSMDGSDLLAAGGAARRVAARHVVGIAHVDHLVAGLPLVLHEAERPRADRLLDLLAVGRGRDAGGHDEGHVARRLAERFQHEAEGLGQLEREGLLVLSGELAGVGGQQLAQGIALGPPLDRLDRVLGDHRLAVVPLETVAQRERPLHALVRRGPLVDHLRLDLQILIGAEQRVVDQVGVVPRDVGGRPDRIEHLEIGVRDEAHGAAALLRVDGGEADRGGGGDGGGPGEEVATTEVDHGGY